MPTTPQEKAAKWPWVIYDVGDFVLVVRFRPGMLSFPAEFDLDPEEHFSEHTEELGDFPTLAAAIAAIAKTQE